MSSSRFGLLVTGPGSLSGQPVTMAACFNFLYGMSFVTSILSTQHVSTPLNYILISFLQRFNWVFLMFNVEVNSTRLLLLNS